MIPFKISSIILGVIPGSSALYTRHYVGFFLGAILGSILHTMLDVFPAKIHGAIPVANPRLIYGDMLFKTFFWRLFWVLYGMFFWMLIGTLIGILISIYNGANF